MLNAELVRLVDRFIGVPVCFLLTIHRKIRDLFSKDVYDPKSCKKILFIKLTEQGSTVLAYDAFKRAVDMAGRDNIFIMVFDENRPILDILDIVPPSNIIEIASSGLKGFTTSIIRAIKKLRELDIDGSVDMEFFSRASAALGYLSGARARVGLHPFHDEGHYRGDLLTHRLVYDPHVHTKITFSSLVEAFDHRPPGGGAPLVFGLPESKYGLPLYSPRDIEKKELEDKVRKLAGSFTKRPVIIFNPNIGDILPIRKWPEENFIELGKMVKKEFKEALIIITGTRQEEERALLIVSGIEGAISLAGQTSLRELVTLFGMSDLLVTNDSGPAHFACLTKIKSIVLFGPETSSLYSPDSANSEVISSKLACSPCINVYNYKSSLCKTGDCLKFITPKEVFEAVKKALYR